MTQQEIFDVIIVGGGAAGLTAGIYSSRARLSTLILNEGAIGGQMVLTEEVANYPGVESTKGYLLANTMKNQAEQFGCQIKSNLQIKSYDLEGEIKLGCWRMDPNSVRGAGSFPPGGRTTSIWNSRGGGIPGDRAPRNGPRAGRPIFPAGKKGGPKSEGCQPPQLKKTGEP